MLVRTVLVFFYLKNYEVPESFLSVFHQTSENDKICLFIYDDPAK